MHYTRMQVKPDVASQHDQAQDSRRLCVFGRGCLSCQSLFKAVVVGLKLSVVLTLLLGAVANLYIWATLQPVMNRLQPVIHSVDHVVERANVVFYIFYQLGCNSSQLIPPALCAQLETSIH